MAEIQGEIKKEPRRWFRFYAESINDPKVQRLPAHLFKTWVNLLCVTAQFPDSTISDADMAWRLRLSKDSWAECKQSLVADGFLTVDNKATYEGAFEGPLRPSAEEWSIIRARVFKRDDFTCRYCGERGGVLECDHVIPVSRGGGHEDSNLVTSCRPCNRAKRDKIVSIEDWSATRRATR